eukprot:TRINITY_DN27665_c0_g1_i2.p1 TRINITY_DN27665_c0_g1~~TRINITY_DN27665_c0_g1_i2.p1  ORF type:complete len:169 (-),score=63.00 TRINITY_DN27665_c0_g1_i2:60-506(-)
MCIRDRYMGTLIIRDNHMKDGTGDALQEAMRVNKIIKKLVLERNPIGYKYINEIDKCVKVNVIEHKAKIAPMYRKEMGELVDFKAQKIVIDEEMEATGYIEKRLKKEVAEVKADFERVKKEQRKLYEELSEQLEVLFEEMRALSLIHI